MAQTKGELINIRVICPKCKKDQYIEFDFMHIKESKKGVTAILIPQNSICEHSFQIFVDKNGIVRGYETPDFELQVEQQKSVESELEEKISQHNFDVAKSLLGEEIFFRLLRSLIEGNEIFCVSESKSIREYIQNVLKNSFKEYCPKIYICSLSEYNSLYSKVIYSSQHKNAFVFNADIPVIIKSNYKKEYKKSDYKFEISTLEYCEQKQNDREKIADEFYKIINYLLKNLTLIKDEIESEKLKGAKAVEKYVKKLFPSQIEIDAEFVHEILMSRLNYNMNKKFSLGLFY